MCTTDSTLLIKENIVNDLKTYYATYSLYHPGPGRYTEYKSAIVIASNETEALDLILTEYMETSFTDWSFEEISSTSPTVFHLSSDEVVH